MRKTIKILMGLIISGLLIPGIVRSQDVAARNELESVLKYFKNYRFGNVSIWQLRSAGEINKAIKSHEMAASGTKVDEACVKSADPAIVTIVSEGVKNGDDLEAISQTIFTQTGTTLDPKTLECIFNNFKSKMAGEETRVENAYVITDRTTKGALPDTIIALIVSYDNKTMDKNLKSVNPQNIYTYDKMKGYKLDTGFTANNLYDLVNNAFIQANVDNMTLEAQGLGTLMRYAPKMFGLSKSLVLNENDASGQDIQQFLRISDAQPESYGLHQNEVILSPDLISWRLYELPGYFDKSNNFVVDSFSSSNLSLPTLGLELKYGNDEINYPSFWSERLTASAIWQSVKLGVILPTDGWASMTKDLFNEDRTLTYGGVGIAGSFDFPMKVIPQSGIFHFNFGYVFGDAHEATYKNRNISAKNYVYADNILYNDYLIRANATFHYTFGVKIDSDYWFRFGLGASLYNAEKWYNVLSQDVTGPKLVYKKSSDETVAGMSGRIEFMATNAVTPFGASIQYFDEALSGNIWLQVPIVKQTLALRLDTKAFFVAFRKDLRQWEQQSVFIPMARIIVSF